MKSLISLIFILTMTSCLSSRPKNDPILASEIKDETTEQRMFFDEELIASLFDKLTSNFEIDFKQYHLESLLKDIDISQLKEGGKFQKEMLFEDFDCDCLDKIEISFSKKDNRFILWVYEEFYDADLDWCPESSYSYSFQISNHEISDLKLDFMAG